MCDFSDPKVGQLQPTIGQKDQILWLNVTVDNTIAMRISNRLDELLDIKQSGG
jgi:hypothetical protein